MSATEQEIKNEQTEEPERALLRRTFDAEISEGEGRTIDVRIVPYDKPARVQDNGRADYLEEFAPGAFDNQMRAANRVVVNFEHAEERGKRTGNPTPLSAIIGHGKALLERSDALYGSFKIHEGVDEDKALKLVHEGVLHGVSLEFAPLKSIRTASGVVRRIKAHLDAIALTRNPAYEGASILAVREAPIFDEELLPLEPSPELLARCRALGIELPQRYQAHPDETDTSAQTDTSEDGTGRTPETQTQEEAL